MRVAKQTARLFVHAVICCLATQVVAAPVGDTPALPEPLPIEKSQEANRTVVIDSLKAGTISNPQTFESFFKKYELPRMTSHTLRPESDTFNAKEDLPGYRKMFKSRFLNVAKGAARTKLNEITFDFLTSSIIKGKSDEVLKYNAVLMMGDLTVEASISRPALLEPKAYQMLMQLAKWPDPKFDYLKVAGLVGLERHAAALAATTAGPAHEELSTAMLTLLGQKQPPEGRTAGGHAWIRTSAAKVLGSLGAVGKDLAVPKALASVITEETAPLSLRFAAVEGLGQMNYPANAKLDVKLYVREIGKLALATINDILTQRDDAKNAAAAPVADDMAARRKLKSVVRSVNIALNGDSGRSGLAKLAPPQDKSIKQLTDALRTIDLSIDKDAVDEIPDQIVKLEEVLQAAFGLQRTETDKAVVGSPR